MFTDVRQAVRGRKPRPYSADLQATEGEDTSHHRQLHQAVPRVRREGQEEDQNVPEKLSEKQTWQGRCTLGRGESKFILSCELSEKQFRAIWWVVGIRRCSIGNRKEDEYRLF